MSHSSFLLLFLPISFHNSPHLFSCFALFFFFCVCVFVFITDYMIFPFLFLLQHVPNAKLRALYRYGTLKPEIVSLVFFFFWLLLCRTAKTPPLLPHPHTLTYSILLFFFPFFFVVSLFLRRVCECDFHNSAFTIVILSEFCHCVASPSPSLCARVTSRPESPICAPSVASPSLFSWSVVFFCFAVVCYFALFAYFVLFSTNPV